MVIKWIESSSRKKNWKSIFRCSVTGDACFASNAVIPWPNFAIADLILAVICHMTRYEWKSIWKKNCAEKGNFRNFTGKGILQGGYYPHIHLCKSYRRSHCATLTVLIQFICVASDEIAINASSARTCLNMNRWHCLCTSI